MTLGGLTGLITVIILGLGLVGQWYTFFLGGWKEWQGPEGLGRIWLTALAWLGGLALMTASLQLASPDVHSRPWLRRLSYASHAVLNGLMLLVILLTLNLLTYVPWNTYKKPWQYLTFLDARYDWTRQNIYSLGSKSENILKGLDRPVRVHVIMPTSDHPLTHDIRALLDNCQAVSSKIKVEYLFRDRDARRINELAHEYNFHEAGVLVVTGDGPRREHRFISANDLREHAPASRGRNQVFSGENALLTAISSLTEPREESFLSYRAQVGGVFAFASQGPLFVLGPLRLKPEEPVVYFTQGSGEMDILDQRENSPNGAGELRRKLQRAGALQVKGLKLESEGTVEKGSDPDIVVAKAVPDDAALVIVAAGPRTRLSAHALEALGDYLQLPGSRAAAGPANIVGQGVAALTTAVSGPPLAPGLQYVAAMGLAQTDALGGRLSAKKGKLIVLLDPSLLNQVDGQKAGLQNAAGTFWPASGQQCGASRSTVEYRLPRSGGGRHSAEDTGRKGQSAHSGFRPADLSVPHGSCRRSWAPDQHAGRFSVDVLLQVPAESRPGHRRTLTGICAPLG